MTWCRWIAVLALLLAMSVASDADVGSFSTETVPGYTGGSVSLYKGKIAFAGWDGNDNEIYLWDGTSTTQITNNSVPDYQVTYHGGEIAYVRGNHPNLDLWHWNGTSESKIHDGTAYGPSIYDGKIAYHQADDVYLWDGTTKTAIPDLGAGAATFPWMMTPSLYDGEVAFQGYDGSDYEIYYWDGSSTVKVTTNSVTDWNPSLYDGKIAWSGWDGSDYEIYLWDGTSTSQITDNTTDDYAPSLFGSKIAWQNDVNVDGKIYFYDGQTTYFVGNGEGPSLYGNQIAYSARPGGAITLATYVPLPPAALMGLGLLATIGLARRLRRRRA